MSKLRICGLARGANMQASRTKEVKSVFLFSRNSEICLFFEKLTIRRHGTMTERRSHRLWAVLEREQRDYGGCQFFRRVHQMKCIDSQRSLDTTDFWLLSFLFSSHQRNFCDMSSRSVSIPYCKIVPCYIQACEFICMTTPIELTISVKKDCTSKSWFLLSNAAFQCFGRILSHLDAIILSILFQKLCDTLRTSLSPKGRYLVDQIVAEVNEKDLEAELTYVQNVPKAEYSSGQDPTW